MNRAIIAPMTYPALLFNSIGFDIAKKPIAFISDDFITIQKCNGIYKDFVRINLLCIKIL